MADQQPRRSSLIAALDSLHETGKVADKIKSPGKKKVKKRKYIAEEEGKPTGTRTKDDLPNTEEVFEYSWPTCACGMNHPPIPHFTPPNGKQCSYYWQIADAFPYLSLYRALTTEIGFIKADKDQSGLIELHELQALLKDIFDTKISDKMIQKTFKQIDLDSSGTIDFFEVLTITFSMIQRDKTDLPYVVQNNFSKICSIQ